jgi:hypothetical protein
MTMTIGAVASSKAAAAAGGGAVRFSASNHRYTRSASGLSGNQSWTFWAKLGVDRDTYSIMIGQDNAGSNYYQVQLGANGTVLGRDSTSGGSANSAYDMVVGTWVFVATVNDTGAGTDIFGWHPAGGSWSTVALGAGVTITGPADANTLYIGSSGFSNWFNGSIAAVKIWNAVLTVGELQAERDTYAAVKTSGLWANYKFNAGPSTTDDSGLGKTLTAGGGSPALDSSGPPIT